ncbi:galaxin isoform X2 [Gadus morhua]|uniref:galaxin isoform X2 n=1 Tax=Gadus morhua TaxID=8049 RepID=UPI0011B6454B|nr:galaxin-like isoform X2 [Gadus morhua]
MALQGVILYLLVLFPAALLIEDSPNSHPYGPPITCGRISSEKLLRKKSSNSICCGDEQYSPDTHCCCLDGAFRTEARDCSLCCEQDKNQAAPIGDLALFESNVSKDDSHNIVRQPCHPSTACCGQQAFDPSSAVFCGLTILVHPLRCCGGGAYHTNTQLCCGPLGREKILSKKHEENICCGDAQYNNGTHECLGDPRRVKERPVSPGTCSDRASIPRPAGLYNPNTQLCCGPLGRRKILSKKHEENNCCGDAQYNNGTHECLGDPPSVKERPVSPGTRSDRASIPRPADSSALPVSSVMAEQLAPSTVNLPVAEPGGRPRVRVSGRGPADPPDSRGTGPAPSSPSPRTTLRGMLFRSGRR